MYTHFKIIYFYYNWISLSISNLFHDSLIDELLTLSFFSQSKRGIQRIDVLNVLSIKQNLHNPKCYHILKLLILCWLGAILPVFTEQNAVQQTCILHFKDKLWRVFTLIKVVLWSCYLSLHSFIVWTKFRYQCYIMLVLHFSYFTMLVCIF